jgi:hypothetical protein
MQDVSTVRQCGGLLARADGTGIWTQRQMVSGHLRPYANNGRILLVNPLQSSRSTFSRGSLLSFFAFKEGMLGTPISVLGVDQQYPGVFGKTLVEGVNPTLVS